jgi:hypothetical protein
VQSPALTIGLAVQPDVVRELADKPSFRGRGLLGRFFYSLPPSNLGVREIDPAPVSEQARQTYRCRMRVLLRLQPGTDEDGRPCEHGIRLDNEARAVLRDFQAWLEPQLGEFGELGAIGDWGGKLAGGVARIAGVLHMAALTSRDQPWDEPISAATMRAAVEIGRYLIPHARAAYRVMGEDGSIEDASLLLRWIARSRADRFTQREAYRGTRGRFGSVERLEKALAVLVERCFVRPAQTEKRSGPGRPSASYDVNPRWRRRTEAAS